MWAVSCAQTLAYARRLVALDPWREDAHRTVMSLLAAMGEPAAALAQFEACRQVLAEQLQTPPTSETLRLAERIRGLPGAEASPAPSIPLLRHNLPVAPTPFVGREEELEAIAGLLAKPECRLISLLGPGGIGKTRLALQVALRLVLGGESGAALFPGGIWFVPPREVPGDNVLFPAIAEAVGLPAARSDAGGDRGAALLSSLRPRRLLLIIDGFEHLLAEAAAASRLFRETARRVRFGFRAGDQDHSVEADRVLRKIRARASTKEIEKGLAAGVGVDLDRVVADLLESQQRRRPGIPAG